jgi:hypothetical protein
MNWPINALYGTESSTSSSAEHEISYSNETKRFFYHHDKTPSLDPTLNTSS